MYSIATEQHQQAWLGRELMRSKDVISERTQNSMTIFYVTFGVGTILRGYHAAFHALNEDIVHAFMKRKAKLPYCAVYDRAPKGTKPLQDEPELLCYQDAAHV